MFTIKTVEQVQARATAAAETAAEIRAKFATVGFADYALIAALIEAQAAQIVWGDLAQRAAYAAETLDKPEAEILQGLAEIVTYQVFGFSGARSSSTQSNEQENATHLAWVRVGHDSFGLGRAW